MTKKFRQVVQTHADIGSFHIYSNARATEKELLRMKKAYPGRPLMLTEYMARPMGSTFKENLDLLKRHDVGAIHWGLVEGRSGTLWPWWSYVLLWQWFYSFMKLLDWRSEYPSVWFHDVFWRDGTPFRTEEIDLIKQLTSKKTSHEL